MTQVTTETMMTSGFRRGHSVPKKNVCPYCKGSGFEIVQKFHPEFYGPDAPPIDYAVPCRNCDGKRTAYREETRNRVNLPSDAFLSAFNPSIYFDKDGNKIDFSEQYKFIRKYIEKFPKVLKESDIKGLYIYSATGGSGKTFIASIICNEIYNRHQIMPIYVTENALLNEIDRTVASTQDKPRDVYQKAQLLFIDDLWRKKTGREWLIDEMFNIIDYRYNHNMCTIVTSNVPLNDGSIDKRIASRLNEMCVGIHMPECEVRYTDRTENRHKLMDIVNEE